MAVENGNRTTSPSQGRKENPYDQEASGIESKIKTLSDKEYTAPEVTDYKSMYDKLAEPTKDEQKRKKRDQLFAAIGDGVSALSNLYFASQGAPSLYNGETTHSGETRKRWDKLIQEKKNNALAAVNMKRMQDDDTYKKLAFERSVDSDKLNSLLSRWSKIMPYTTAQQEYEKKVAERKAAEEAAASQRRIAEAKAIAEHKYKKEKELQEVKNKGAIKAAYAKGSNGGKPAEYTFNGKTYKSEDAWERAVEQEAANLGISLYEDDTETTDSQEYSGDKVKNKTSRTVTKKKARNLGSVASEVEKAIANQRQGGEDYSQYEVK